MLGALLVTATLARVSADWVEISQQHYRKPARTHHPVFYPAEDTRLAPYSVKDSRPTHPVEDTRTTQNPVRLSPTYIEDETLFEGDRRYANHSITEHNWNQNKNKVPGKIKRVDLSSIKLKPNITPQFTLEIYGEVTENAPELVTNNVLEDKETVSATIERVSSKGSVKRVQLSNTPVKSPAVLNPGAPIRRNDGGKPMLRPVIGGVSDEFEIKSDIFQNTDEETAVTPFNYVKHVFSGHQELPDTNYGGIISTTAWPTSEPLVPFQRYPQTNKSNTNISNIKNISASNQNTVLEKTNAGQTNPLRNINTNKKNITATTANFVRDKNDDHEEYVEETTTSSNFEHIKNNNPVGGNAKIPKDQNTRQHGHANSGSKNKMNEGVRVSTMENVMKFMKVVADTISANTRRGVGGKVKYLNDLKETLLSSIQERIDATWPDDTITGARRRSRSQRAARGHVEFPSSESALMTISFLTFAVFLIKLVLQVIHTYKNKAMMVAPLVVATAGRTVRKLRNFH